MNHSVLDVCGLNPVLLLVHNKLISIEDFFDNKSFTGIVVSVKIAKIFA